jgi:hypothetical protein
VSVCVAVGVVVVALALMPLVYPAVDWGMDGELTPGEWDPHEWLGGLAITVIFLSVYAVPVALLVLIVVAVVFTRGGAQLSGHCPTCDGAVDKRAGNCPRCGPLPPRRVGRRASNGLLRMLAPLAVIAGLLFVAIVLSSTFSWVMLELEEDAFGERARAAEAAGHEEYQEITRIGSVLTWRSDGGYFSHRD